jgi:undecaprenyl-diphosphatase
VYQLYELRGFLLGEFGLNLFIATIAAGIVGYLSIDFLLRFLRSHSTGIFIAYRIALGIVLLILLSYNIIQP